MQNGFAVRVSAWVGFLGVALGAFGAHALKETLARNDATATWQTAVLYHLIHASVLLVLAFGNPVRRGPWFCFLTGVVLFSGSLYGLALTGMRWLGPVTPLGGVFFLAGWAWLGLFPHPQSCLQNEKR
ncbi:MAG: DUF423 domain-containing protein [Limisphaerales bacterium]